MATDLLQSIINEANNRQIINHPISDTFGGDYPIIQYADDTIIIMLADTPQLLTLKALLRSFADSTGLRLNFAKSSMVPINTEPEKAAYLANTFGCQLGSMPFTYLDLPLGTTKPSVMAFMPIPTRIKKD